MEPVTLGYLIFRGIYLLLNDKENGEKNMTNNSNKKILVFGTSGTGKTSLCNALSGGNQEVGDGAKGVTFKHYSYPIFTKDNQDYEIIDTIGLNESDKGTINSKDALKNLLSLLRDSKEGYNLLIHVVKMGRLTNIDEANYNFFVNTVSESKIPVLLVVTNCENRTRMSDWAVENIDDIKDLGFNYAEIACTSFAVSDRPAFSEVYRELREESINNVFQSISNTALHEPFVLYNAEEGFMVIVQRSWNWFCRWLGVQDWKININEHLRELLIRLGFSKDEAEVLAENNLKQ